MQTVETAGSTQQTLAGESQETIRKPIIASFYNNQANLSEQSSDSASTTSQLQF